MTIRSFPIYLLFSLLFVAPILVSGQVSQKRIQRVENMPNMPSPYQYKDWTAVAKGFDAFVFDETKTGTHLPLIFTRAQGANYPSQKSFGLDTYIGTVNENNGEAINVLPALIGATLVGIDKSQQNGNNWILASQDYFNKQNGQLLYLNNIGGRSGNDWWYDVMPNVYFYQLYDLYGSIGDADFQFTAIADQFAEAVRGMDGSDTPWQRASMNYRAYDFLNEVPNEVGVPEPETAGSMAWVLYHAYKRTQNQEYLKAAEWSMEYLSNLGSNPSYELQLPYGTYLAAKMNAEIATNYDVEKLLFWCFNRGSLRGWGTIVGNWGGVDVSGLVGEANDNGNDYAFQLNGVQQAAALVPMTRYDKRFARTVGKWMLNLSNATRFFFSDALPASLQDSEEWSNTYDPNHFIGYEALREVLNGQSPFATGDAIKGGWAATNLSLYSSSSIGYLGALIQETDQEKILQLDLLKTDFFREEAYPSYLIYNPYTTARTVNLDLGTAPIDLYDVISESFLATNISGIVSVEIPADGVVSLVYAPAGGVIRYENNKMYINEVVVDYRQTQQLPYNYAPRIQSLAAVDTLVELGDTLTLFAKATDIESKNLNYFWEASDGRLLGEGNEVQWVAPDIPTTSQILLIVTDDDQNADTTFLDLTSTAEINVAPVITDFAASSTFTSPGGQLTFEVNAFDQNQDALQYTWSADAGELNESGNIAGWTAPGTEGIYTIRLQVTDNNSPPVTQIIRVLVRDFSQSPNSNLIAHYPFSGNANDISGNNLNGDVFGAKIINDATGDPSEAYFFDGVNDRISVANNPLLNFTEGISVNVQFRARANNDGEVFLVSHGSWQNRWKVSMIPDKKIRWTIRNANGSVADLDSDSVILPDSVYHVSANYDGAFLTLYLNGRLESFQRFSGAIRESPVGLEMGQMLPDENAFNFSGYLEDVQIYDQAIRPEQAANLAGIITSTPTNFIDQITQINVFPNPTEDYLQIDFQFKDQLKIPFKENLKISIIGLDGRLYWREEQAFELNKKLNIRHLESGIYFLKITLPNAEYQQKFMKK